MLNSIRYRLLSSLQNLQEISKKEYAEAKARLNNQETFKFSGEEFDVNLETTEEAQERVEKFENTPDDVSESKRKNKKLSNKQKKIAAAAPPDDIITGADFKALRDKKKKEEKLDEFVELLDEKKRRKKRKTTKKKKKSSSGGLSAATKETLKKKAKRRGLTPSSVYAEYRKGLAAYYSSGSRKGMTAHQWAHARVNSANPSKSWAVVKKAKGKKKK